MNFDFDCDFCDFFNADDHFHLEMIVNINVIILARNGASLVPRRSEGLGTRLADSIEEIQAK